MSDFGFIVGMVILGFFIRSGIVEAAKYLHDVVWDAAVKMYKEKENNNE